MMKIVLVWIVVCFIWSTMWLFIKLGLRDLPPVSFAGLRLAVAVSGEGASLFALACWCCRLIDFHQAQPCPVGRVCRHLIPLRAVMMGAGFVRATSFPYRIHCLECGWMLRTRST